MGIVLKNYKKINDVPTAGYLITKVIPSPFQFSLKCQRKCASARTVLIFHFPLLKLRFEDSNLLGCYAISTNK